MQTDMKLEYPAPACETYNLAVEGSFLNDISNGNAIQPPISNSIFKESNW